MIVVHFVKVSALYPRVVISSLPKRLENLIFAILYTFFGVWPRDDYMSLQRFTTVVCHALLWFPPQALLAVQRFPPQAPLATCGSPAKYLTIPHSSEQDTLLIVFLICKQAVPYQTRGSTCYPRVLLLRFGP
jgi:hypothetical protein